MSHNTSANQQQGAPAAPELAVDDVDNPQRRVASVGRVCRLYCPYAAHVTLASFHSSRVNSRSAARQTQWLWHDRFLSAHYFWQATPHYKKALVYE